MLCSLVYFSGKGLKGLHPQTVAIDRVKCESPYVCGNVHGGGVSRVDSFVLRKLQKSILSQFILS